jgi:hypothetical protein
MKSVIAVSVIALIGLFVFANYRGWRTNYVMRKLEKKYDRPPLLIDDPDFVRDSKVVVYAIEEWLTEFQEYFLTKNKVRERVEGKLVGAVFVSEILYNHDKTKMISLVGRESTNSPLAGDFTTRPMTAGAEAIVGVRENHEEPFTLYRLQLASLYDYNSAEEAGRSARVHYFEFLTGLASFVVGQDKSTSAPVYNLDDPRFWTSAIWEIGARHPTLYPFQVKQGVPNKDAERWIPVKPLVEEYPQWIYDMYREPGVERNDS